MMRAFVRSLLATIATVVLVAPSLAAQQPSAGRTGRIVGRIVDQESGVGVTDAGIQIVGTTLGVQSGIDGRFQITGVPAGTVTIQVRRLGYGPKTVTGIQLSPNQTLEQNIALVPAGVRLQAMIVSAAAEKGSVSEALDAQRTATAIVSSITSEQISKSADGDAAQAVQRVSGVTVQDGRYVFVRGLGERYTVTQLNGARMPSPEPERRVVPLDLFPTGMLQTITTSKTFTPDQQGDFSGAQVDIRTREFPALRTWSIQTTFGLNPRVTGKDALDPRGVGGESFASAGSERGLPPLVRRVGNFQDFPLNQGDKNRLVSSFRNVWTPTARTGAPNGSTALSFGGSDPILGVRVGYLLSGTYSYSEEMRADQRRAQAGRGTVAGSTIPLDEFSGHSSNVSALLGGLFNASVLLGQSSRIALSTAYSRTSDNEARTERGKFENEAIDARIDRIQYVERAVKSAQLAGEHQFGTMHRFDWSATLSGVQRDEPDRSEFVYEVANSGAPNEQLLWLNTGNGGAVRTFSELSEDAQEGKLSYQLNFTTSERQHLIKIGGLLRRTERDADTRSFSLSAPTASSAIRGLRPEEIFDGRFSNPNDRVFEIAPLSQGGAYDAKDNLSAAFAMAEVAVTDRLRVIGGARFERDVLDVNAHSTLGQPVTTSKEWNDLLPALALNVKLNEAQSVRLSLSRTLARPEYRELSPIKSRDVLNGDDLEGNPNLERTRIENADLRWEWYPTSGEVLSVAVFAKRFDQPIERVYRAAGANSRFVAYVNAKEASNFGVELEARKDLSFLGSALRPFTLFSNVTLMNSKITLDDSSRAAATNPTRSMVGQAPYVLNLGLTGSTESGAASATLLYNRVGERIDAAGDTPLPDVKELPRNVLDLALRFPIIGALSGRFDAKNLLDAPYETVQGTVTREFYRVGRTFQLGFIWKP
jgi:outer membrane receptor protein involved in Fe transport